MHHDTVRAQERLAWSGDLRMRIASGSLFVPALPFFLFFLHFGLLLTQRTPFNYNTLAPSASLLVYFSTKK